ncbi:hypothetical protein CKU38_00145 [Xanthomonas citri pv. fuscans]|nr:hypothetical protein CKU38_00145 [Xanthomonas citri pv. fuscans]
MRLVRILIVLIVMLCASAWGASTQAELPVSWPRAALPIQAVAERDMRVVVGCASAVQGTAAHACDRLIRRFDGEGCRQGLASRHARSAKPMTLNARASARARPARGRAVARSSRLSATEPSATSGCAGRPASSHAPIGTWDAPRPQRRLGAGATQCMRRQIDAACGQQHAVILQDRATRANAQQHVRSEGTYKDARPHGAAMLVCRVEEVTRWAGIGLAAPFWLSHVCSWPPPAVQSSRRYRRD